MAREWGLGSTGSLNNGAMDETLIEVFGCVSLNAMMADAIERSGTPMDETLIEVFGCVALDHRVVWLDTGRERKTDRRGLKAQPVTPKVERGLKVRYH